MKDMKTTRYHLERVVQNASVTNEDYLKQELREVLESNKPYESKCDYLGYSILSLDEKIKVIDEQLEELKQYKQKLKDAKSLVLEVGASIFTEYGISKIEGGGISSITVSKELRSSKSVLSVKDEKPLIDAGFYKLSLDEKALLDSYNNGEYIELIEKYCSVQTIESITKPKLRVNRRRASNNDDFDSNISNIA